jgi:hypothetical protein
MKIKWPSSSSASRRHSKVARSTPTRARRRGSAPASSVVMLVTLLLTVLIMIGSRKEEGKEETYKKAKSEAHLGKEWDSDCSSSDDEGLAASTFNKSSLFPNEHHTCLMAKEKKVCTRNSTTYASSSDDESSDDEIDYASLFKGLDRTKIDKINELIDSLNDKNRLLEKQEDLLYEEHDKFVDVQKSLALEVKRNEMLSCELSTCHETISSLKMLMMI